MAAKTFHYSNFPSKQPSEALTARFLIPPLDHGFHSLMATIFHVNFQGFTGARGHITVFAGAVVPFAGIQKRRYVHALEPISR